MWIYNTFAVLVILASAAQIRAANQAVKIDSIYFPDDTTRSISKRQVNKNYNLHYQRQDRIVENRHSVASQWQQQQINQIPLAAPTHNPIPTSSQFLPSTLSSYPTLQSSQSYNYDPITDFAWGTFKGSKIPNPIGNLILCPLLVQLLLSQIEVAAVGRTKDEIANVIRNVDPSLLTRLVNGIKTTKYRNEINLASAIFSSRHMGLNATFVQESRSRDVSIRPVDFANTNEALYIINSWISSATKNHIRNLFKPEDLYGLRVLLTNTMYFRGVWKTAFNESLTSFDRFDTTDKLNRGVTFMNKVEKLRGSEFHSASGARGTWIELPYDGNEFSMVLILPEIRHTLDGLIQQLTTADIANIIGQLEDPWKRLVYLKMPKFSIQSSFSLTNVLQKMGLVELFTVQSQLPYFTNNHEPVTVSAVLQHSVLNVDEYGSVATAATSVSVVTLSLDGLPRELVFVADQPFLAIIVDKRSRVPLFVAKIFDP